MNTAVYYYSFCFKLIFFLDILVQFLLQWQTNTKIQITVGVLSESLVKSCVGSSSYFIYCCLVTTIAKLIRKARMGRKGKKLGPTLKTWIIFYLIPRQWQQIDRKKGETVL